jgi:superfamily II DNA or RNA helicase
MVSRVVCRSAFASPRGRPTLVLVHRRQLLDQWIDRLSTFLGLSVKSIGRIGGGRDRPSGIVDVAVIQSLFRKGTSMTASQTTVT